MLKLRDLRHAQARADYVLPRAEIDIESVVPKVAELVRAVRDGGSRAVLDLTQQFDGCRPESLRVPQSVMREARRKLPSDAEESIRLSIDRVRSVHADQMPQTHTTQVAPGASVSQRWTPVNRVGLYVPGGNAVYPSSVVMNVVPAQVAGVGSLAVVSPPQTAFGGWPHPLVLGVCDLLGVSEVYACGGAQAVAWLAYGSDAGDPEPCEPVSMITGPGNVFVAAAKRVVAGQVGIDSEAGPTEIMVIADDSATPDFIAADLISQAEHDVLAASILVTDSEGLANEVAAAVVRQVADTRHRDRVTSALTGSQSCIALVKDLDQAVTVANIYGAEHLEIHTHNPHDLAARIVNAGAVFVGDWTPVSLGDYCAGSNHVLPTGGCACFSSGLSVFSFLRSMQVVDYSQPALVEVAGDVEVLSAAEDLPAHGAAVAIRRRRAGES